jgi:DNA-directed RNA polymerase subunit RPC12/RpoP
LLRFCCENCGQRIKVAGIYAGRRGKCPKCGSAVLIPVPDNESVKVDISAGIDYERPGNVQFQKSAGKGDQNSAMKEGRSGEDPYGGYYDYSNLHSRVYSKRLEEDEPPERKLPAFIDVFLYPFNLEGIVSLSIFWLMPLFIDFLGMFIIFPFLLFIPQFIIFGYMYYYFMDCVRESSAGWVRAPQNIANMPDLDEAVQQAISIVVSLLIFWGPVAGHVIFRHINQGLLDGVDYDFGSDPVYWVLMGYGVFFFPMGLLSLAMFDSITALNPFLLIRSILITFFPYLGMVMLFCVLAVLFTMVKVFLNSSFILSLFSGAAFVYMAMVTCHLLGRFYYKYSERLDWEV